MPQKFHINVLLRSQVQWYNSLVKKLRLPLRFRQLVTHLGMFDLDDLMNNTLGALFGWLSCKGWLL